MMNVNRKNDSMKKILVWGLLAVLGIACYDDLGNYDYNDINDMVLEMPRSVSVTIPKKDSVLVEVKAAVTQLDRKDNANLTYLWKKNLSGVTWTECGTDSVCRVWVYPKNSGQITLRLAVTDTVQNIVTFGETVVNLVAAFNRCWFVLQNIGENAVLGCIDGDGSSRVAVQDIYAQETGGRLQGKPLFLSINNLHLKNAMQQGSEETLLGIFTEGGKNYMLDGATLEERYAYNRMLLYKKLNNDTHYAPMYAEGDKRGECIIDDGVFWFAKPDGFSVYYPVKAADGDYYAERASLAYDVSPEGINIIYDSKNKRFLSYYNADIGGNNYNTNRYIASGMEDLYDIDGSLNEQKLETIGEQAGYPNKFDPNNIGDKDVIYIGATTSRDVPKIMAIASQGSSLYIYEISPEMIQGKKGTICSGYWELTPETGLVEGKLPVATSAYFDRMFYYAVGNKIYRADLTRSTPRSYEIYAHPDPSVRITRLKFRNRRLIGIENHLVPLDTISPDPKIAALVRQYEQAPELLRRVGETTVPMDKVALLNLQVDAILARTQTDFAFYNWNGMRIDTHAAAPFTVADVFAMEPFGSVLYQLPMRLSDLRELILNKFNYNGKEGHTVDIYPAGGTYTIVTNAKKQGVDVLFFDRDGRQLTDETRVFQVTLPDYLHSTYVFPLRGSGRALDLKVTDLLMDYLSGHRPLPVDTAMRVSIRPVQ